MGDSQVEQVKQKTDIVEIIGERVPLKRAGRNLKGLCPFHGEKTPSFFVSPEMQMYKCFGCGASGDVFSFLQAYEGLTFPEALEQLAKRAGITLTRVPKTDEDKKRERYLTLLDLAAEYYHYLLTEHKVGETARAYLKGRGIYVSSWKTYQLGYAPEGWRNLCNYLLRKKGYTAEEVIAAGLGIAQGNRNIYDRFRGRVMFPQKNASGMTVGFAGRVLDPDVKEAKYVNTPETSVYHKGEILFGLSIAKSTIRQKDRAVVVEGELDVISSHQAGVKEVVAVKGSALTDGHLHWLRRLTHNVLLALDADTAGQEAIKRAIALAEPVGLNLRVVQLTGGKDPDELAQKEADLWKEAVEQAVSVYQFYLDLAFNQYDGHSGSGQKQISQLVVPVLARIENAVEQAYYTKQLAQRLGVSETVVEREMAKVKVGATEPEKTEKEVKSGRMQRRERLERLVVATLLHFETDFQKLALELEPKWFSEIYMQRLVEALQGIQQKTATQAVKALPEALKQQALELYRLEQELFEYTETILLTNYRMEITELRKMRAEERVKELNHLMAKAESNSADLRQWQALDGRIKRGDKVSWRWIS
jgi:DNA primase